MRHSARVWQACQDDVRRFGDVIDFRGFAKLYADRERGAKVKVAKVMDGAFLRVDTPDTRDIVERIGAWSVVQAAGFEQRLFRQRKRLAETAHAAHAIDEEGARRSAHRHEPHRAGQGHTRRPATHRAGRSRMLIACLYSRWQGNDERVRLQERSVDPRVNIRFGQIAIAAIKTIRSYPACRCVVS